ncbi:MAG: hypothetical protein JF616_02320 [Fibrobacteres bacterium]|jgi:hypothetical protein|nr:hypothetical protein [Fibrobacterota bacterium]
MQSFPSAPHPIAFASLPWQLVLAFIVFNIVAGMISKRKQGKAKSGSPANPRTETRKAEMPAAPAQARREAPKPAGKGLLEQLARELGLELPQPTGSAPVPQRAPARPVEAASARPQTARQETRRDARPSDKTNRSDRDERDEASRSEGSDTRPTPAPMTAPAAQALVGPGDFTDPEALRKAFIIKVILDKPIALQRRR